MKGSMFFWNVRMLALNGSADLGSMEARQRIHGPGRAVAAWNCKGLRWR
jgi:hypothetical protein